MRCEQVRTKKGPGDESVPDFGGSTGPDFSQPAEPSAPVDSDYNAENQFSRSRQSKI